jgi:hypothetical protein
MPDNVPFIYSIQQIELNDASVNGFGDLGRHRRRRGPPSEHGGPAARRERLTVIQ